MFIGIISALIAIIFLLCANMHHLFQLRHCYMMIFLRIKCFFAHFLLKNSAFHSESSDYSDYSDYSEFSEFSDYSEFSDHSDHSESSELLISSLYPLKKIPLTYASIHQKCLSLQREN